MLKSLIRRMKHRRFCKLNGFFCPDCIYHDFVFVWLDWLQSPAGEVGDGD